MSEDTKVEAGGAGDRRRPGDRRKNDEDLINFSSWRMSGHEIARLLFMVALIAVLFWPDFGALRTMSYVMGVFIGVALIAHVTRKYSLFPYLDMRDLYMRARKDPMASAIVFASVCGVLIVCISTAASFFVRS